MHPLSQWKARRWTHQLHRYPSPSTTSPSTALLPLPFLLLLPSLSALANICVFIDIDQCAVRNGGCDLLTNCTNNFNAPPNCSACPLGYNGTGYTGCISMLIPQFSSVCFYSLFKLIISSIQYLTGVHYQ